MRRAPAVVAVVIVGIIASVANPGAVRPVEAQALEYRAPVDGPVVSPFSLPPERWMAGNRGVDYDPPPGTAVTAAADGEVAFAGPVGGSLHVTLRHADGLRTSYSFLAGVSVTTGGRVRQGDVVGVAGGPIHFGVRDADGTYLDPAGLLDGTLPATAVLVPGSAEGADLLVERQGLLSTLAGTGLAATTWAVGRAMAGAATVGAASAGLTAAALSLGLSLDQLGDCTPRGVAVPAPQRRRIAVVVSGLGTGSGGNSAWELPTTSLGYAPGDVVRFSYAGGRSPDPAAPLMSSSAGLAGIEQHEFTARDSQQSLTVSADRLAELVAEVAAREPGVAIDVIAHSQGGVVSRMALDGAARAGQLPETVETLVTLGSPHAGAPAADIVDGLEQSLAGQALLEAGTRFGGLEDLDRTAPAGDQLGTGSEELRSVADRSLPAGVRFTSIGARWDLVVPAGHVADAAAREVVVDPSGPLGAHGALTTSPEAIREVGLAIAGLPPTCQAFGDLLFDRWGSHGVGLTERAIAALATPSPGPTVGLVADAVGP